MSLVQDFHRQHIERRRRMAAFAKPDPGIDLRRKEIEPAPETPRRAVYSFKPIRMVGLSYRWGEYTYCITEPMEIKYDPTPVPAELRPIGSRARVKSIIEMVAAFYRVPVIDVMSARRTANVVLPRMVAMYLARVKTLRSLPELGRIFNRDHSSIHNAVQRIVSRMEADSDFRDVIEAFERKIDGEVTL